MDKDTTIKDKEGLRKGLIGFIPFYGQDGGNYTRVLFKDLEDMEVKRSLSSILKELTESYQKDLRLVRKKALEMTGQRSMNPLPLAEEMLLLPFKFRKPIGKDDGAIGYIKNESIERVMDMDDKSKLILKDGREMVLMESYKASMKHISYGRQMDYELKGEASLNMSPSKADIEELCNSIERLTSKLEELIK